MDGTPDAGSPGGGGVQNTERVDGLASAEVGREPAEAGEPGTVLSHPINVLVELPAS